MSLNTLHVLQLCKYRKKIELFYVTGPNIGSAGDFPTSVDHLLNSQRKKSAAEFPNAPILGE